MNICAHQARSLQDPCAVSTGRNAENRLPVIPTAVGIGIGFRGTRTNRVLRGLEAGRAQILNSRLLYR